MYYYRNVFIIIYYKYNFIGEYVKRLRIGSSYADRQRRRNTIIMYLILFTAALTSIDGRQLRHPLRWCRWNVVNLVVGDRFRRRQRRRRCFFGHIIIFRAVE